MFINIVNNGDYAVGFLFIYAFPPLLICNLIGDLVYRNALKARVKSEKS